MMDNLKITGNELAVLLSSVRLGDEGVHFTDYPYPVEGAGSDGHLAANVIFTIYEDLVSAFPLQVHFMEAAFMCQPHFAVQSLA